MKGSKQIEVGTTKLKRVELSAPGERLSILGFKTSRTAKGDVMVVPASSEATIVWDGNEQVVRFSGLGGEMLVPSSHVLMMEIE